MLNDSTKPPALLPTREDREAYLSLNMLPEFDQADVRAGLWDHVTGIQVFAAHRLRHSPAPDKGEGVWPDIGPDPFQGPRENDNVERAHKRLRDAYAKQQPHVPNQTALVWRVDIGRVHQRLVQLEALFASRDTLASPATPAGETFQARVQPWLMACFGEMIAGDREERNHRFLEEALELVQACGCTASEAHQLVDYVFGRPVGEPAQEVGGVMVTLAALCLANELDMHQAAETELARIWNKVEAIRAKQAAKPKHSPLPEVIARPEDDVLLPHLPEYLRGEKRCGIQRSAWLDGWFVPWSPRNENENAEGPWSHWVALAERILAEDAKARAALATPPEAVDGGEA